MAAKRSVEITAVEGILRKTMEALNESRTQMYDIMESARGEYNETRASIQELRSEIHRAIGEVERRELQFSQARKQLLKVSRHFDEYSDDEKQRVYVEADRIREALTIAREKEKHLRARRQELEKSLTRVSEIVERGEKLLSQVSVAMDFLSGNLEEVSQQLEGLQARYQIGQRIIRIHEEERKRVAREIHDGPAQDLANVVLQAEICEKMFGAGRQREAMDEIKQLKAQVKVSLQEVRKIIHNLRPMALDDLGLVPALKRILEEAEEASQLETELLVFGKNQRLPSTVEVAVFRTVQEAVNNCRKHAKARRLVVKLEFLDTQISAVVEDNGQGFDEAAVRGRLADGSHFGLFGMRERIELIGGQWKLRSSPGEGTRITLAIPLENATKEG